MENHTPVPVSVIKPQVQRVADLAYGALLRGDQANLANVSKPIDLPQCSFNVTPLSQILAEHPAFWWEEGPRKPNGGVSGGSGAENRANRVPQRIDPIPVPPRTPRNTRRGGGDAENGANSQPTVNPPHDVVRHEASTATSPVENLIEPLEAPRANEEAESVSIRIPGELKYDPVEPLRSKGDESHSEVTFRVGKAEEIVPVPAPERTEFQSAALQIMPPIEGLEALTPGKSIETKQAGLTIIPEIHAEPVGAPSKSISQEVTLSVSASAPELTIVETPTTILSDGTNINIPPQMRTEAISHPDSHLDEQVVEVVVAAPSQTEIMPVSPGGGERNRESSEVKFQQGANESELRVQSPRPGIRHEEAVVELRAQTRDLSPVELSDRSLKAQEAHVVITSKSSIQPLVILPRRNGESAHVPYIKGYATEYVSGKMGLVHDSVAIRFDGNKNQRVVAPAPYGMPQMLGIPRIGEELRKKEEKEVERAMISAKASANKKSR